MKDSDDNFGILFLLLCKYELDYEYGNQNRHFILIPFFQEYGGTGKSFVDCKDSQLEKLQKPPLTVWTLKGGHPMVRYEKK